MKTLTKAQKLLLVVLIGMAPLVYASPAEDAMAEAIKKLERVNAPYGVDQNQRGSQNDPNSLMLLGPNTQYPVVVDPSAEKNGEYGKIIMYEDGRTKFVPNDLTEAVVEINSGAMQPNNHPSNKTTTPTQTTVGPHHLGDQ